MCSPINVFFYTNGVRRSFSNLHITDDSRHTMPRRDSWSGRSETRRHSGRGRRAARGQMTELLRMKDEQRMQERARNGVQLYIGRAKVSRGLLWPVPPPPQGEGVQPGCPPSPRGLGKQSLGQSGWHLRTGPRKLSVPSPRSDRKKWRGFQVIWGFDSILGTSFQPS